MEPEQLVRWTRFAAKGGIGKCTAVNDYIAQHSDDLMFLQVRYWVLAFFFLLIVA